MDLTYPLTNISEPGANDVLCGRGGASNNHIGNRRFRMLVDEHRMRYKASGKLDKPKVAREVMVLWRNQTPPGRFLAKAAGSKVWNDVGDQKAREKASQCLRERPEPSDTEKSPSAGKSIEIRSKAKSLCIEKEVQSPNYFPEPSARHDLCQQQHLSTTIQQDLHKQQEQLLQLRHLKGKVEQMLMQQHNFTNYCSELTQEAFRRQDQEQLYRVQEELRRRQEEVEQRQLALMRSIEMTCNIPQSQLLSSLPTLKNDYNEVSPRASNSPWLLASNGTGMLASDVSISREISASTSTNLSDDNADAHSMMWSVESKVDGWRSAPSDYKESVDGEYNCFNWSRDSLQSVKDDSDSLDIDCMLRSLCHRYGDKESIDDMQNIAYSSHAGSIIGTAHSLLSFRSDADSMDINRSSNNLDHARITNEGNVFRRSLLPSGSQVGNTAPKANRISADTELSTTRPSKAALAVASTLSTMSLSDCDFAEFTPGDAEMDEIGSSITRFSSHSASRYWDQICMPRL